MTVTLGFTSSSTTSATISMSNILTGATSIDVQLGTRPDFQNCIAPLFNTAIAASLTLPGLNRDQGYYARARARTAAGPQPWGNTLPFATQRGTDPAPATGIGIEPAIFVVPEPVLWIAQAGDVAGYPPANLANPSPTAVWRSSSGYSCVGEMGGRAFDTVALLETNIADGTTMTIAAGATLANVISGSPTFSQAVAFRASSGIGGRRGYHGVARLSSLVQQRFVRISITGTSYPGAIMQAGHAVVGRARSVKNYSDLTVQHFDLGTLNRYRDGTPDVVGGFRGRRVDLEISAMTETQLETQFGDLFDRVGLTDPLFCIPNSRQNVHLHDRLVYGPLLQSRVGGSNMRFNRLFSMESLIN